MRADKSPARRTTLSCDTAEAKAAIATKADVNARDTNSDETPLMTAAYNGCVDVARVLIAAGADVNAKVRSGPLPGQTALISGSFDGGNADTVKVLIAAGADLNAQDAQGSTALATAARYGKLEIVEALANAGADVNTRGGTAMTPLAEALFQESPTTNNPNFGTPKQHADIAEFLREHGGQ